jgi:sugar-specific transcriptional regulator TrmB
MMIFELMELGLTNGEAKVYLSLLKLGSSKVGSIVKDCRVSYSKVYDVLERLILKGLVSYVLIGNIKHFNAVEPYRLQDYIQKKEEKIKLQKDKASKIIPDLVSIINKRRRKNKDSGLKSATIERNHTEIFKGDQGLRTAYEILLSDSNKGEVLRYFYPYSDYHNIASPFYLRLYMFQKSKNLTERGISTMAFKKSRHYQEDVPKDVNLKFVNFPLPGTMDIFRDKILMIEWENKIGLLISSEEMSNHFKNYFDSIWILAIS